MLESSPSLKHHARIYFQQPGEQQQQQQQHQDGKSVSGDDALSTVSYVSGSTAAPPVSTNPSSTLGTNVRITIPIIYMGNQKEHRYCI